VNEMMISNYSDNIPLRRSELQVLMSVSQEYRIIISLLPIAPSIPLIYSGENL